MPCQIVLSNWKHHKNGMKAKKKKMRRKASRYSRHKKFEWTLPMSFNTVRLKAHLKLYVFNLHNSRYFRFSWTHFDTFAFFFIVMPIFCFVLLNFIYQTSSIRLPKTLWNLFRIQNTERNFQLHERKRNMDIRKFVNSILFDDFVRISFERRN